MTQKSIKTFVTEVYSKPPKNIYPTNKSDVSHIDDIWNLDILDLKVYGPENNRSYRYVLIVIEKFSKFGCTKNKTAQTIEVIFRKQL